MVNLETALTFKGFSKTKRKNAGSSPRPLDGCRGAHDTAPGLWPTSQRTDHRTDRGQEGVGGSCHAVGFGVKKV